MGGPQNDIKVVKNPVTGTEVLAQFEPGVTSPVVDYTLLTEETREQEQASVNYFRKTGFLKRFSVEDAKEEVLTGEQSGEAKIGMDL